MGDDIGMWNIGAYHRGLMAGPYARRLSKLPDASGLRYEMSPLSQEGHSYFASIALSSPLAGSI
jgi:hypothetical protein